jgi:hypothetical protein
MYGNGEAVRTEHGSSERELDFGACEIGLGYTWVRFEV